MLPPSCPRCQGTLVPPGVYASYWRCSAHGEVAPLRLLRTLSEQSLAYVAGLAGVPQWLPQVGLPGWTITGLGFAGDQRAGARATIVAATGPAPLGGEHDVADLIVVAEEPGIGVGAAYAGLAETHPALSPEGRPAAKILADGHPTPLWTVPAGAADRDVFLGEAGGVWLWLVLFPPSAGYLLAEPFEVVDGRRGVGAAPVRFGPPTSRLHLAQSPPSHQ